VTRDRAAALADLYAQVPKMEGCDLSCWESCGPVPMGPTERARVEAALGAPLEPVVSLLHRNAMCPALSAFGRCLVYDVRPLLCRLWGAVQGMPCPRGCRPVGGPLTDERARQLIEQAMAFR